jgi:2-methylisocitrate lyase-like PEP mutase family enzyme
MAAHNPLAAKLAMAAGFDAVWGSAFLTPRLLSMDTLTWK